MDLKLLLGVFATIFAAELGDKTQLATLLFAADHPQQRWGVFIAAAAALVLSAAVAVLLGHWVSQYLEPRMLSRIAGVGFILIGAWTLIAST